MSNNRGKTYRKRDIKGMSEALGTFEEALI